MKLRKRTPLLGDKERDKGNPNPKGVSLRKLKGLCNGSDHKGVAK